MRLRRLRYSEPVWTVSVWFAAQRRAREIGIMSA
jgi:hypothetical protein